MRRSAHFRPLAATASTLLLASALQAGAPPVVRSGGYWVQTESGSEQMTPRGRLKISFQGAVSFAGSGSNGISWSITRKVHGGSQAEALALLEGLRAKVSRQGSWILLVAQGGPGMASLQVQAPRSLAEVVIGTQEGNVEAVDVDGMVRAETGAGRMTLDRIGGGLVAKTAGGDIRLGTIRGTVKCISAGGSIRADEVHGDAIFQTAGGEIVARRVDGTVRCSTAAGGIHITEAGGTVYVDTAGGPIEVGRAQGVVTARNSGGPIQVGAAAGVRCESQGGPIRLTNVSGSLRASTVVGSIIARVLADHPLADSFLSTGAGDITVFIPSNIKITVRARNDSGGAQRIVSEFPALMVRHEGGTVYAEGLINGGGPVLRLIGTSGTIYIRRER